MIEVAPVGLESTTFELIATIANAAQLLKNILATQLLEPLNCLACLDSLEKCDVSSSVSVASRTDFESSDGPMRYTFYAITITSISIVATVIFTPFLPKSRKQCEEWRLQGCAAVVQLSYTPIVVGIGDDGGDCRNASSSSKNMDVVSGVQSNNLDEGNNTNRGRSILTNRKDISSSQWIYLFAASTVENESCRGVVAIILVTVTILVRKLMFMRP